MRSSSLSKKAREEKAQHVPLWFWSLIEVIGFSLITVNFTVSFFAVVFFSCAAAGAARRQAAAAIRRIFFILLFLVIM